MTYPAPASSTSTTDFYSDSANAWLFVSLLPGLGAKRWQLLLDHLDDPLALLQTSERDLSALGMPPTARKAIAAWQGDQPHHPLVQRVQQIRDQVNAHAIELVTWGDRDYPPSLRQIHGPPLVLYLRGQRRLLGLRQIGIVGSRHASRGGLDHARQFARALSEQGYAITSGLALGVDGAAHRGALDAKGPTLAILGTGVDVSYPRGHCDLAEQIASEGALVSEFAPGTPPRAVHFPRRNRIISGLSQGILVVEAGLRSGSLITARLALEQGREVFAIPGSIHNPLARGCHHLIRQGAKLVECVADIEEELAGWWQPELPEIAAAKLKKEADQASPPAADCPAPEVFPDHLSGAEKQVFQAVGFDPCCTDTLCEQTGFSADQLMQSLLLLEMEGLVETVPGGVQRVC